MRITIKKKSAKRLASLSALGAGALAVGVPTAEAGIVYTPVSNTTIGFSTGSIAFATFNLAGTARFNLHRGSFSGPFTTAHVAVQQQDSAYFQARSTTLGLLRAFPAGAVATGNLFPVLVAAVHDGNQNINRTNFGAVNKYFMFTFADSTQGFALLQGWGQLAVTFSGDAGPKPDVTIVGYAYETTPGVGIVAGDQGSAVPEPSSLALSGLGALLLGASGIRRWRAARQS
jgi:hypothetical protein